jgi:hypothetical protein
MVNEFTIYSLLSNYANATDIKTAVDKYDFYIFPVVNPDGFVYTQTNTRLWRKNRAPNAGSTCDGTDINRNWAAQWAETGGASTNPCDQDFKGPSVGSTPEYKALSSFQNAKAKSQGVIMYMDIHSYSQLWMTRKSQSPYLTLNNWLTDIDMKSLWIHLHNSPGQQCRSSHNCPRCSLGFEIEVWNHFHCRTDLSDYL